MAGIYLFLIAVAAIPAAILAWPGEVEILPVPQKCPDVESKDLTVHLAHPDCTKFCKCNFGAAVEMDCPAKLHFNKELQVCDYPGHAKCDGKGVTSGVCGGNPKPEPEPEPEPAPKPKPESLCRTCAAGCDGVSFPHEYVRSMYYECRNGNLVMLTCSKGQVWDKKEKKCKPEPEPELKPQPAPKPKPEPEPEPHHPAPKPKPRPSCRTCAPGCDGVTYSHEYVRSMYYECRNGNLVMLTCPNGQVWGKREKKCKPEPEPKSEPESSCVTCAPGCDGVTYPHEYVRSMYYECRNGDLVMLSCPNGQVWAKKEKKCKEAYLNGSK